MITHKMPKEYLQRWLAALRSGKYRQGKGTLKYGANYCCLGVLQHCLTGNVERDATGLPLKMPTDEWLHARGIKFNNGSLASKASPMVTYSQGCDHLTNINDDGRYTFKQIANILENNIEEV